MLTVGVTTAALALAGAFLIPTHWEAFCLPFIGWVVLTGWVLTVNGRHAHE